MRFDRTVGWLKGRCVRMCVCMKKFPIAALCMAEYRDGQRSILLTEVQHQKPKLHATLIFPVLKHLYGVFSLTRMTLL